jgi:hypothetical protein
MKLLLAFAALLAPVLATAQTPNHLYVHPHLYTLRPSAPLYQSLSDTVNALATQLDPGQIVSARASDDIRWAWVSNILGNLDTDSRYKLISKTSTSFTEWYVRRDDLIMLPDKPTVKSVTTKHRRKY